MIFESNLSHSQSNFGIFPRTVLVMSCIHSHDPNIGITAQGWRIGLESDRIKALLWWAQDRDKSVGEADCGIPSVKSRRGVYGKGGIE